MQIIQRKEKRHLKYEFGKNLKKARHNAFFITLIFNTLVFIQLVDVCYYKTQLIVYQ